jgi:hypothetical protein
VVAQHGDPLVREAAEDALARLDRLGLVGVVKDLPVGVLHGPDVVVGGVGGDHHAGVVAFEQEGHVAGGVAVGLDRGDARGGGVARVQEGHAVRERTDVGLEELVVLAGPEVELDLAGDVGGVREGLGARVVAQASDVVGVHVGEDDMGDVGGLHPGVAQRGEEAPGHQAGVEEDAVVARDDQGGLEEADGSVGGMKFSSDSWRKVSSSTLRPKISWGSPSRRSRRGGRYLVAASGNACGAAAPGRGGLHLGRAGWGEERRGGEGQRGGGEDGVARGEFIGAPPGRLWAGELGRRGGWPC